MKKLVVTLHRRFDAAAGRNEKIKSRLRLFEEKGWDIDIYNIIEPETENDLLKFLSVFWQSILTALRICSIYDDEDRFVLWTMNAPSYLHIPGLIVKKFIKNIKWVPEFRDEMCEEPFYSRKPKPTRTLNSLLEGPIMKNADMILKGKGSKCSNEYFYKQYPQEAKKVSDTYFQGYDREKTKDIEPKHFDKFTILYAGRFYQNWIEPITFLKGLSLFIKKNNLTPDDVNAKFYVKKWIDEYDEILKEYDIKDFVEINDFVQYKEIISIMKGSDLLLYITGVNKSNKEMINSKFWDYISIRGTIFLLSDEDFVINEIVRKFNIGFIVDEKSPKDIADKLETAYNEGHSGYRRKEELDRIFDREKYNTVFLEKIERLFR